MPPAFAKMRNSKGLAAHTREHEGLKRDAVSWMIRTTEFCMFLSAVIVAGMFDAAVRIRIRGGGTNDETGKPNYSEKTSFSVFVISNAIAFFSSWIALLVFMVIRILPYAEYDFHKSLPLRLIYGFMALFISIPSMMVAFGSAFFLTYCYGLNWTHSLLPCLPILVFIGLQSSPWSEILYST